LRFINRNMSFFLKRRNQADNLAKTWIIKTISKAFWHTCSPIWIR